VNLEHYGEEIRFENNSVLLAMAGIIATRVETAEAAQATGAVSQAYIYKYSHILVGGGLRVKLHWNPASYDQDCLCEIS